MEAAQTRGAELRNDGMGREEDLGAPAAAARAVWAVFGAREDRVWLTMRHWRVKM